MGIVIINGQRYDAATGLRVKSSSDSQVTSDFADLRPSVAADSRREEQVKIAAERAAILGDAVADATVQPVKKDIKEIKRAAKAVASGHLPSWITNYVDGGAPREIKPLTEAERQFRQRIRGNSDTSARRKTSGSVTLNRRYVKKPSSELANKTYAEPLALSEDRNRRIKQIRQDAESRAQHASNPTTNPVRGVFSPRHHAAPSIVRQALVATPKATTAVAAATKATETPDAPVHPILTKRQAAELRANRQIRSGRGRAIDNFMPTQTTTKRSSRTAQPDLAVSTHKVKNVYNQALSTNRGTAISSIKPAEPIVQHQPEQSSISTSSATKALASPILSPEKIDQLANAVTDALIQNDERRANKQSATNEPNRVEEELRAAKRSVRRQKRAFRMPAIATAAAAVAILAGYGVYAAYPNVQVRVAASKAGINAQPTVALNGYHISGPVAYANGEITVNYRDGNGSTYSVNQRKAAETDKSLRTAASSRGSSNMTYEEISAGSTNIYRYDDKATWVKDGMVYTIDTNDRLTNEQISTIAKSV